MDSWTSIDSHISTAAMKLSIASAILCTALLASSCNAFPYPDYWDREEFLEQLQQEERVGANVKARIEQELQGNKCSAKIHSLFFLHNIIIQ